MTEKATGGTPPVTRDTVPLKHYRTFGKMLKGRRRLSDDEKGAVEFARTVIAPLILDDE